MKVQCTKAQRNAPLKEYSPAQNEYERLSTIRTTSDQGLGNMENIHPLLTLTKAASVNGGSGKYFRMHQRQESRHNQQNRRRKTFLGT